MPEFIAQYGTEAQCEAALERVRWPEGFRCPRCGGEAHCVLHGSPRKVFQCNACWHQASLIAGTVQLDDAYLGGERTGGKAGRGSENKEPFVAAVSLNDARHPLRVKLTQVTGFSSQAITEWARAHMAPGSTVHSGALACFNAVAMAPCQHEPTVVAGSKPKDLPEFQWVNTVLGNLKTRLSGSYHAFAFAKYATRYLGAFAYRFNRRFDLATLPARLLVAAADCRPLPEQSLRLVDSRC